jgi:DNA-binding CsgD family transcriptional regulator
VAASPAEPIVATIVIEQAQQLVRTRIGDSALVEVARSALELAERTGIQIAKARSVLGLALAHTGRAGWNGHYRAAAEIARAEGDSEQEFAALYWLVSALGLYGPMQSAWEIGEELLVRTQQIGSQRWHNHFLAAYAVHRFGTGTAPDDLLVRARRLIDQDPLFRNRAQLDLALTVGLIDSGKFDAAAEVIADGRRFIRNDEDRSLLCVAQCELAWATGMEADLRTMLNELATCRGGFFGMNAFAESAAIYLGLEQSDDHPMPRFRSDLMPNVDVVATEHVGFDQWRSQDPTAAIATFVVASDEWLRRGFPRFAARARLGAGQIARLAGLARADRHCAVAADIAKRHNLVPILRAVDRERALHAQSSLRAALTPREFEVLDLVADGLTTTTIAERLGLQRSTVESHVLSARRKLGASTRAQVATMVLAGRV